MYSEISNFTSYKLQVYDSTRGPGGGGTREEGRGNREEGEVREYFSTG
jgi:hypothetical protein